MTQTSIDPGIEDQALRGEIYRLLGRLLLAAPDTAALRFLAGLEAETDDSELAQAWQALARAAAEAAPRHLERAHFRLLVGVIQGEITPYASWYLNGTLMDAPLVALRRDLRRLGIARIEPCRDPEDHLGALCEAMALLVARQDAQAEAFFTAHLVAWAEPCFHDLAQADTPFYAATGRLGAAFIASERHRYGLPSSLIAPRRLPLVTD